MSDGPFASIEDYERFIYSLPSGLPGDQGEFACSRPLRGTLGGCPR